MKDKERCFPKDNLNQGPISHSFDIGYFDIDYQLTDEQIEQFRAANIVFKQVVSSNNQGNRPTIDDNDT